MHRVLLANESHSAFPLRQPISSSSKSDSFRAIFWTRHVRRVTENFSNIVFALVVAATGAFPAYADSMSYLDNGVIRLGVDLAKGGTITYLSNSGADLNVVNSWDLGREVQQSYYSGPINYGNPAPPWTNFPWNPVAAGDTYRNAAAILQHSNDGKTLYTKTTPMQWALSNEPCECSMEQWITLQDNSVRVRNRLTNNRSDRTQYNAFDQELPAVYTNGTFWRLFTYTGDAPYTGGQLTQITAALPNPPTFSATERWAALVNDSGFGLGVFNAFTTRFIGGFAGTPGSGGPSDDPTGYISPIGLEVLDWNIVYDYEYALVLGTLDQIRAYAVAQRPHEAGPNYRFTRDRQHFALINAPDVGWPINGSLRVHVDQNDPYLIGPQSFWQAEDVPRLYIRAAYHTSGKQAQIFWSTPGETFAPERSVLFSAIPDGNYHTYTVDLAASPAYQGAITGIRFDPMDGNEPNGYVDIASVTSTPPRESDRAYNESPAAGYIQSGVGLIRGWTCEAEEVAISIDSGPLIPIGYGTQRKDTASACGDSDNGYGMVIAWGLLGNGPHGLQTFIDGEQIDDVRFDVVAIGDGFVKGLQAEYVLSNFPSQNESVRVTWSEADQNFVITGHDTGSGFGNVGGKFTDQSAAGTIPGAGASVGGAGHETPAQHSIQSGVGLIRGWACNAQNVEVSIDSGARIPIAYGTARADTQGVCGDANNGYGMVIAWGLLGNGVHHMQTFVNGVEIANVEFEVVALGNGFVTGLEGTYRLSGFPAANESVDVRWSEPDQNFMIFRHNR